MSLSLVAVDSYDILNNGQSQHAKYGFDPAWGAGGFSYVPGTGGVGTALKTEPDGGFDNETFRQWPYHPYQVAFPSSAPAAWIMQFDLALFHRAPTFGTTAYSCALYGPADGTFDQEIYFGVDVASSQYFLIYTAVGSATIRDQTVLLPATYTWQSSTSAPTYDNIQMKIVPGSSGNIEILINGVSQINQACNTSFTSSANPHCPGLYYYCGVLDPHVAYDNWVVWACSSTSDAIPAPMHVYGTEMAATSGSTSNWVFGGSDSSRTLLQAVSDKNYEHVINPTSFIDDNGGSYIFSASVNQPIDFTLPTQTTAPTFGVAINVVAGGAGYVINARCNGTNLASVTMSSLWQGFQWVLDNNPSTGLPFTLSQINSATFGFQTVSPTPNGFTEFYIEMAMPASAPAVGRISYAHFKKAIYGLSYQGG